MERRSSEERKYGTSLMKRNENENLHVLSNEYIYIYYHALQVRDPPLSSLGHNQARECAAYLKELTSSDVVSHILVSPYLRVIQTASYTADLLDMRLCIEEALAETHHIFRKLPFKEERFRYFPQINTLYKSNFVFPQTSRGRDEQTGEERESYPPGYLRRMWKVAQYIDKNINEGETLICFSHAASVALIAGLLRLPLGTTATDSLKFAPCGVYHLERDEGGPGSNWRLIKSGNSNQPFVTSNSEFTYAWGFNASKAESWNKSFHNDFVSEKDIPKILNDDLEECETDEKIGKSAKKKRKRNSNFTAGVTDVPKSWSSPSTTAPPIRHTTSSSSSSSRRIADVKTAAAWSPVEIAKKKMAEKRKKRLSAAAEEIMNNSKASS